MFSEFDNYFSFCSFRLKINFISSILSRSYKISSTYLGKHEEFDFPESNSLTTAFDFLW